MIDLAYRLRVGGWSEPWDFIEGEIRTGRNDEIVIVDGGSVIELDPVVRGINPPRSVGPECDAETGKNGAEINRDIALLAPSDRDLGIGGDEGVVRPTIDQRQPIPGVHPFLHLECHERAAKAAVQNDDVGYGIPSSSEIGSLYPSIDAFA